MKILQYQDRAVKELVDKSIRMLGFPQDYQNLVFKAPTGSGKTVMATRVLADLHESLLAENKPDVAFVWIAPQKLHLQSFEKLKKLFAENRRLTPILYNDIDQSEGVIKSGEILFVNWESVNSESNLMVKDRESADSFFQIIDRTRLEEHRPIYLIVDEEHRNWGQTADRSLDVVQKIHPKVELRISATPKTQPDQSCIIDRSEVIAEQMIKKGIYLNEDINVDNNDANLNMHLLHKALDMRQKMADEYERLGVNINPMLLIQLPNDSSETLTSEERSLKDSLVQVLKTKYDISVDNGRLGIWLSGENTIKGHDISKNDDMTQVLLFKQAIALGWDCPRAAVLLIFRNLQEETFTVQTLGRILRMPEQHFYPTDILNYGHVYTDLSKDQIKIAIEDGNYINKESLISIRRDGLHNITLPSYYQERRGEDHNRLGPDFKHAMLEEIADFMGMKMTDDTLPTIGQMENWTSEEIQRYRNPLALLGTTQEFNRKRMMERGIEMNVKAINIQIPRNLIIQNMVGEIDLKQNERVSFARTQGEIQRAFYTFCHMMVVRAGFEPKWSTQKLASTISELLAELFGTIETDVPKVIHSDDKPCNITKFKSLIEHTLSHYTQIRQDRLLKIRKRAFKETQWEIPPMRFYNYDTNKVWASAKNHATMPLIGSKDSSDPEQHFTDFLEQHTQYIDWWYKNGDEGMTNFAISYTNVRGEKSLFYVDYIIRMKNGAILLFDTKSKDSDPNGAAKHNALKDYMTVFNAQSSGPQLDGGILIEDKDIPGLWKYSASHIKDTHDTSLWQGFYPEQYKGS